jgi:hypothetical protein
MSTSKIVGLHPGFYDAETGECKACTFRPSAYGSWERVVVLAMDDGTETILTARIAAWLLPDIARLISNEFRSVQFTDTVEEMA